MATSVPAIIRIEGVVSSAISGTGHYLLAVSGGRDSMVLLDAVARLPLTTGAVTVATFDHGTGPMATRAARLAAREAGDRGLQAVMGHARGVHRTEEAWRAERWDFLRSVSESVNAAIVTAHTLDDQLETVVIRVLRDAGARGLAGLYAPTDVLRPLLPVTRAEIGVYARERDVTYIEDPTNASRRYLRNRVRLDLLPAIERAHPGFAGEMLALSRRAAIWRRATADIVDQLDLMFLDRHTIRIAAASLGGYDAASLRVLWPEVAARAGLTMDRRGTERAAAFTIRSVGARAARTEMSSRTGNAGRRRQTGEGGRGRVIQLSGGGEIEYIGGAFIVRRK